MKVVEARNSPVLRSQVNATHHWRGLVTFPVLAAMLSNLTLTTRSRVVKILYTGNIQAIYRQANLLLWALLELD